MDRLGYLKLIAIFESSDDPAKLIESASRNSELFQERIMKNPWDLNNCQEIENLDINELDDVAEYALFFKGEKYNLTLTINGNLISVEYLIPDYEFVPNCESLFNSNQSSLVGILIGYEINVWLENLYGSILQTLEDSSQYPLYYLLRKDIGFESNGTKVLNFNKLIIKESDYSRYIERLIKSLDLNFSS